MKKLFLLTLVCVNFFIIKPQAQIFKQANLEQFSFRNPYSSAYNCPIHIRVDYYYSLVYSDGNVGSFCGMQENTISDNESCSFNLKRGCPSDATFIFHNAAFIITSGNFQYVFSYDEFNQNQCGGTCEGAYSYNCVVLDIYAQGVNYTSYTIYNGIIPNTPIKKVVFKPI